MHDLWENSSTENPYFNDFAGWWMDRWEQIPDVWKFPDAEIPSGGSLSQAYECQFGSAETESVLEHYLNRPAMAPVTAEFRRFWQAIYMAKDLQQSAIGLSSLAYQDFVAQPLRDQGMDILKLEAQGSEVFGWLLAQGKAPMGDCLQFPRSVSQSSIERLTS